MIPDTTQNHIIDKLYKILQERKTASEEKSYVASLYQRGSKKIAEKITEEAEETIIEALALEKSPNDPAIRQALTSESADLLFHLLVMLSHHDIKPEDVFKILKNRFGTSGHEEKASRKK